ncbi:unnamed protein product, partial [Cyprideis torosa]
MEELAEGDSVIYAETTGDKGPQATWSRIIEEKKRLLIIFEGRDAAGKGGTIKRCVAPLNPRNYRVTALAKPTEVEMGQWYFQRYLCHLPRAGEMVFFDRSCIGKKEQAQRLKKRSEDPMKNWKLGPLDREAQEKWDETSTYISAMLARTGTEKTPWTEVWFKHYEGISSSVLRRYPGGTGGKED